MRLIKLCKVMFFVSVIGISDFGKKLPTNAKDIRILFFFGVCFFFDSRFGFGFCLRFFSSLKMAPTLNPPKASFISCPLAFSLFDLTLYFLFGFLGNG